ncbi:hypothetical protein DPMN_027658 [Dreissena polymorpha]|uniref:Uncharacterized protein n=1 Tax=Dreissena polymorpha TaxID=45954 RepID=A0A9D4LTD0_DREPO|nr:hypothetical protein DPMN_027658 [Dreissena polymorpha]
MNGTKYIMVAGVIILSWLGSPGHTFILDTITDPCSYNSYAIYCSARDLTRIPSFDEKLFNNTRLHWTGIRFPAFQTMHFKLYAS